jgi:proteic killer suppression protein
MPLISFTVDRFRDNDAERLFNGERRARMRLQRVVAATTLSDLRLPPSHRLESLRGDRAGQYSIRINDQWRVCFAWTDEGAMQIEVIDYH